MTTNSGQEHAGEGVAERITGYLTSGGLFNPEHMPHGAARDLLIDCRAALEKLKRELHGEERFLRMYPAAVENREWERVARLLSGKCRDLEKKAAASNARIAALEAENARLREMKAAAEQVTWFDWSGNDDDAVAAVDRLRAILGAQP